MMKNYHKQHPTISFRCRNIDEYNKIKKMVKQSGKSESTFVREILLNAEIQESNSYNKGYSDAFNKFALPCPFCGKNMIFDLNNNVQATNIIYQIFGSFAHPGCITKKSQ